MIMRMAVIDIKRDNSYGVGKKKIALFPCVGCLGDRTGGNHVQQVLSLTLHSRCGLMGRQAGVHIGHRHTCQETNTSVVNVLGINFYY